MSDSSIGLRIRNIRGKESRASFAERLGIGTATLQRYEGDERSPDIDFLAKLQKLTGYSLDYLVYGRELSIPADEALILEKYRQADAVVKNQVLMSLLGVGEVLEKKEKVVAGSLVNNESGTQSNNVVNNNSSTVHGDQYNAHNQTFHRKESGFTDLPFSLAAAICAFMAWLLGLLANQIVLNDKILSLAIGVPAIPLWVVAVVLMIFAVEKRKIMKKDKMTLEM